jgi:hypothetical protein
MEIPSDLQQPLQIVGGLVVFGIGLSFAWKTYQAAFNGKVRMWTGLEKFSFIFVPLTLLITPFFCHFPSDPKRSLIQTRQQGWVHLYWGPMFLLATLAFLTCGMDMMGLPGSAGMNFVLTGGRNDVPRAIVYDPPFSYKFPILKKVTKRVVKFLTHKVPEGKAYNELKKGRGYSEVNDPDSLFTDDDDQPQAQPQK